MSIPGPVRPGANIILDDVFLGGAESQRRVREHLADTRVFWVGSRCDPAVAAAREQARGDRTTGMAAAQAAVVHRGASYDLEVDTSQSTAADCADIIAEQLRTARC